MTTLHTFGDSVLDCARYNEQGVTPAALLARNDDTAFLDFRGRDLATVLAADVRVVHRATDGATVHDLQWQLAGQRPAEEALVLLTIGGNDLLGGLVVGPAQLRRDFERELRRVLGELAHADLYVGNVYDPSFGDDSRNFLAVDAVVARRAHQAVNAILRAEADRAGGTLVDLHAHFLTGDPTWFAQTIEPSLRGASEVRRAFLAAWEHAHVR